MAAPKPSRLRPPPARVAVDASRVQAWEPSHPRRVSIPAPIPAPVGILSRDAAPWMSALPKIALAMAIAPLVFVVVWFLGVGDDGADHALGDDYVELMAAGRAPVVFQAAVLVEGLGWALTAGFILIAARLAHDDARVRSGLASALGIATVLGLAAAFIRLSGTARLGLDLTVAEGSQRLVLVAAYTAIVQVQDALYHAGFLAQGLGFILVGSAVAGARGLPEGIGGWVMVPGFTALLSWLAALAANNRPDLAILGTPMLILHSLAIAGVGFLVAARLRNVNA